MTISTGYLPIKTECTANQLMRCIKTKRNINLLVLNPHRCLSPVKNKLRYFTICLCGVTGLPSGASQGGG